MKSHLLNGLILFLLLFLAITASANQPHINKKEVVDVMNRITDYQINHFKYIPNNEKGNHHDYGIDAWTNAVFYFGLSEWMKVGTTKAIHKKWLLNIGNTNNWEIPANFKDYPKYSLYHADELCIGQFYLNMYDKYKKQKMITPLIERMQWFKENPANMEMNARNKQAWTWCDALFMAPPVYVHLSTLTGDKSYLDGMHTHFILSYRHLYDKTDSLFYRDSHYFDRKENNGENIFWGRGNGWVLAGLANILKLMPEDSEYRPFYTGLFKNLAHRLSELQDQDGFWHASLLDPESYPSPETSGTALIAYGLLYGYNTGLLGDEYLEVIAKSWAALCSIVSSDGKIGWVQPIGADPKKVTKDMTAVYGTGALLLVGSEIIKLAKK